MARAARSPVYGLAAKLRCEVLEGLRGLTLFAHVGLARLMVARFPPLHL
ncbi:hypothetical protein ACN28I_45095 [Archangium gephyra]